MNKHNYSISEDIFEVSGSESLQKLSESDNVVYLDFDVLEKRAALKEKDRHSQQFAEALEFLNENGVLDYENKRYLMPSGGYVSWDIPPINDSVVHITRDPSIKSKLKREGKKYEEPDFLTYGTDLLNKGFEDVNYNLDPHKITLDSLCSETGIDPSNNMFIRINKSGLIYRVSYPLIGNSEGSRFELDEDNGRLIRVHPEETNSYFSHFQLRTLEQRLAYTLLTDNNVETVVISGGSGSGKTIVSYVAAVEQILGTEKQRKAGGIFEGIILFKSNDIIGGKSREQGFLPGSAYQKVKPFMKSYEDSHKLSGLNFEIPFSEMLADPTDEKDEFGIRTKNKIGDKYLPARNKAIEIEHLQYARGRTFENQLIIVDEAQNYSPYEMKQLIERVGIGCNVYIIGDPNQIDNPMLDANYNGLVYAASVFSDTHPRYGSIYLGKNYRSQSAEIMRASKAPKD